LSGKFLFICDAWHTAHHSRRVEAVPNGIHVPQAFEKTYDKLVKENINAMYAWAEKPLKGKADNQWHDVI
jgi:hypothetical protein